MGRDAATSIGNVWREARISASRYNENLASQDGVAELIGCGRDAIRRIENGLNKVMPVDMAVLLADLYHAPELKNHYCLHECPIGCDRAISEDSVDIDRAALRLTVRLREEVAGRLCAEMQDIAADGEVSWDEIESFNKLVDELRELAVVISEIEVIRDKIMGGMENG